MSIISYVLITVFYFFVWTLCTYWMHRLSHISHKYNFLFKLHLAHHKEYSVRPSWPKWYEYFLWRGTLKETIDDLITLSMPPVIITIFDPYHGVSLLIIHYIYEVFLGPLLDHNPKVRGKITKLLPFGQFHLTHHRNVKKNYSFYITFWDYVFRTASLKDINRVDNHPVRDKSKGEEYGLSQK